jgi:hypothetical protein
MIYSPPPLPRTTRLSGVVITVALHVLVLCAWYASRSSTRAPESDAASIQWVNIDTPRPASRPPTVARRSEPASPRPAPRAAARIPISEAPAPTNAPETVAAPVAETPAAPSTYDMLQQARKDIGKIDKDLRRQFPGAPIKAPADSPQIRLVKGIEHAAEMAPPKWFEAPKVQEIIDPGGYGRKRYRVITANGTYCITVESNHAPDGLDVIKNGIKPKLTNCPPDEQPATTQKYER